MPRNAPILITGSGGYIGTHLEDALTPDYRVVGMDLQTPAERTGTTWIECNLTSDESVRKAFVKFRTAHGERIASVIHLAAYYDFSGAPSDLYDKLTVAGTRRLLRALGDFQVEQFIFSSTLLVMQPVEEDDQIITETSPTSPEWDYPKSKLRAESVILRERDSIPAVILRIAGVYDEDCNSIPLAQHISRIYERKLESYFFPGDADHGQPFIHIDDLVDCFRRAVDRRSQLDPEEVFLTAEPDIVSYDELQELLGKQIHGREWPTIRIPKAVAKAGAWTRERMASEDETFIKPWMVDLADDHYPVAIERARGRLGWEPKHRLRAALPEMVRRMLQDPVRWYRINKLEPPAEVPERLRKTG